MAISFSPSTHPIPHCLSTHPTTGSHSPVHCFNFERLEYSLYAFFPILSSLVGPLSCWCSSFSLHRRWSASIPFWFCWSGRLSRGPCARFQLWCTRSWVPWPYSSSFPVLFARLDSESPRNWEQPRLFFKAMVESSNLLSFHQLWVFTFKRKVVFGVFEVDFIAEFHLELAQIILVFSWQAQPLFNGHGAIPQPPAQDQLK